MRPYDLSVLQRAANVIWDLAYNEKRPGLKELSNELDYLITALGIEARAKVSK